MSMSEKRLSSVTCRLALVHTVEPILVLAEQRTPADLRFGRPQQ